VASDQFQAGQIVTVFRSRLRPDNQVAYAEEAERIYGLAEQMPGLVDLKAFTAEDGERVTLVTFADEVTHDAWRRQSDHVAAQGRGRNEFYSEYTLQVCSTVRVRAFGAQPEESAK
jgi:heme-degrading monooxygenase HmoA